MTTNTKWVIGLGLTALVVGTIIFFNKKDEPKGTGEVSAETKKSNKIVFTRK